VTQPLTVGVALPHGFRRDVGRPSWSQISELAVELEESGFDSLWVSDHYFTNLEHVGGPAGPATQLDAMVLLPALGVVTHRVRLGTMVLAVGFRHPAVLAKAVASLDRLSKGRFELGLGTGWHVPEYQAAGLDFPSGRERLVQLEETIAIVRAMTTSERSTATSSRVQVRNAPNLPQPNQRPVPVLVAAFGPAALRTAARSADAWNVAWRYSPETYAEKADAFQRACWKEGRDPAEVRRSLGLMVLVGENQKDLERRFEVWKGQAPWLIGERSLTEVAEQALVGTPEQIIARVEQYRAHGVTDLVLSFSPLPFGWSSLAGSDIVAAEILPVLHRASR
jgi:probable F420-dependent oxidoreductase